MKNRKKSFFVLSVFFILLSLSISHSDSDIKELNHMGEDDLNKLREIRPSTNGLVDRYNFKYYKIITIDHTKVFGTNNYSNFPVLISIYDSDLRDHVQSDGDDIAFANDTAWLDHEIELFNQEYNTSHAQLITWIKVPLLYINHNTNITMYYGNPYLSSQENPSGVWDNNYKGVWHMNDVNALDSTSNNNDGTENGGVSNLEGKIAGANYFEGVNEFITIGNVGSEIKSIEFWMNPSSLGSGGPTETSWKNPSATGDDYNNWTNPENAYTSDNLYADEITQGDEQDWYNFNFIVPNGATIDGIQVNVEASSTNVEGFAALSWDGGSSYTSEKSNSWTSEENKTFGSSDDLWGRTAWSSDDFTNGNFRIKLKRGTQNPGTNLRVDCITIKIYYTYKFMRIIDLDGISRIEIVEEKLLTTNFPGTTTIYIDGVVDSSLTADWHYVVITNSLGLDVSAMEIGRVSTDYFEGKIDELRVSNISRTPESFNTNYINQNYTKSSYNISQEVAFNVAPPTYSNLTESSDLLELGDTEIITINATAPSGINQVIIEFEGFNHSMTSIGGDIWEYDSWIPSHTGNYTYIIYVEDNCNNWNTVSGTIMVIDTTPPLPPIIASAPSGEVFGNLVFDWEDGFDLSGISFYILIIDTELDPFATPEFVFNITIPNTGSNSSFYELTEILSPGEYFYFLLQIDGVGKQSDFETGSFTIIATNDGNNNFSILNIIPYILASLIGSITVIIILKRRFQKKIHPRRKKIPLKTIIFHINKISSVKPIFEKEELQEKMQDKKLYKKELINEKELKNQLYEIKALGEELFNEGAYLEALKQFEQAENLLLNLGKKEEAMVYSKLVVEIKTFNEEREKKLEILEQEKLDNNFINIFELYFELIEISKKLKDFDAVKMYQYELIQLFKIEKLSISDLENKRDNLEEQANSLLNKNLFQKAAQLYENCEEISQYLVQLGRGEENSNVDKFRTKKSECLRKISS